MGITRQRAYEYTDMDAIDLWFAKDEHAVSMQIFMHAGRTYVGFVLY
jgi:hypothetical protein